MFKLSGKVCLHESMFWVGGLLLEANGSLRGNFHFPDGNFHADSPYDIMSLPVFLL